MGLTTELKNKEISMMDTAEADLVDFISIEKSTHNKYVVEHKDFFGEWNEEILIKAFELKRTQTFFKKLVWNNETVGFLGYNRTEDQIDNVFIRIIEKFQNKGIGTLFLLKLKEVSGEFGIPVWIVAVKTNPAQNLYKRLGFEFEKEENVFYYFKYMP